MPGEDAPPRKAINDMTASRLTKTLILVVTLVAVLVCVLPFTIRAVSVFQYSKERNAVVKELVSNMQEKRCPADANPDAWEAASVWTINAVINVCFSDQSTPIAELRRFRADVEKRLRGEVDFATFDWIWTRLAETGTHGQKYHRRFEADYRESVNEALQKNGDALKGGGGESLESGASLFR
jgi:hypothetical protein